MDTLARGVAVGFAIAAPIGPIGLLCIYRTVRHGFAVGFASGAGAATADAIYALLAGLALSFVTSLFVTLGPAIHLAGAAAIAFIGIRTMLTKHAIGNHTDSRKTSTVSAFLTTFALTMVNPLTILSFAALVSASSRVLTPLSTIDFVAGVGVGSLAWWLLLSAVAALLRRRLSERARRGLDVLSGAVLVFLGFVAFLR